MHSSTLVIAQEAPTDDPDIVIHVVQRGENLFRIAQRYGMTTEQLAAVNNITNPGNILVGQRLIVSSSSLLPMAQETPAIHVVRPGETLRRIADFYGVTIDSILALNDISDPNRIVIGQEIRIRASIESEPNIQTPAEPDSVGSLALDESNAIRHTIQRGETLFGIATTYGVTVSAIQSVNDIPSPSRIFAGQEIIIPGAVAQTPSDARDLPALISDLAMNPLTLTEGRTGRIIIRTVSPATIDGSFLGRDLVFISQGDNTEHIAFLPIPVFTESGVYPLNIIASASDGGSATIILNVQVVSGNYARQTINLPEDRMNLLSAGVEENELSILRGVAIRFTPERYFERSMSLPAAAAMNSPFGAARSYNGGPFDRFHSGADFAGAPGSPVLAAASGRVVLADTLHIRGVSVMIDHGWGVYTLYAHLTERFVNIGDFVNVRQTIGTVGNTGRATGAHLHWETWVNGIPVDPMQWVRESFP